jgi:hypothetical protein
MHSANVKKILQEKDECAKIKKNKRGYNEKTFIFIGVDNGFIC